MSARSRFRSHSNRERAGFVDHAVHVQAPRVPCQTQELMAFTRLVGAASVRRLRLVPEGLTRRREGLKLEVSREGAKTRRAETGWSHAKALRREGSAGACRQ